MNVKKSFSKHRYFKHFRKVNPQNALPNQLYKRCYQKPLPISSEVERRRFEMIQIKMASPKTILQWSERKLPNGEIIGEILKPETMNYRTYKPEPSGLLCQKIFGPITSWECDCNLPKRVPKNRNKPVYCDICWVELTDSRVRRHRMAYITLNFPATHIWYLKGSPSYLSIVLDIGVRELEKVVYFEEGTIKVDEDSGEAYFDIKNDELLSSEQIDKIQVSNQPKYIYDGISKKALDNDQVAEILDQFMLESEGEIFNEEDLPNKSLSSEIKEVDSKSIESSFFNLDLDISNYIPPDPLEPLLGPNVDQVEDLNWGEATLSWDPDIALKCDNDEDKAQGAESVLRALESINLQLKIRNLRSDLIFSPPSKREKILRRIRILEGFYSSEMQPSWMILSVLPVLPAGLRPVFELPTGMYTSSEFNEHYRLIITRNNRLKRLQTKIAPFFLLQNEKLLLQSAIDDLLDNGKPTPLNQMIKNRPLRCLSDLFCGKEGRFRENLLGKRVDYSGRSVIVVAPGLGLDQCGLPYDMAIELFNPYILRLLSEFEMVGSLTSASEMLSHTTFPILWDILDFLSRVYLIVLNRAPTLHRFGIQAFQPVITTGRAIQLHPLVCPAFNADFDGDQMGVHLPLTLRTQSETYDRLLSTNNFLSSATGRPLLTPSQDIVLGWYYLTAYNLPKTKSSYTYYQNFRDVIKAAESNSLSVHSPIWVKYTGQIVGISVKKSELRGTRVFKDKTILEIYDEIQIRRTENGNVLTCYILTTPGRIVLNELIAAAIYAKPLN
uniref:DNA-directed RNA polymerase subunit n=1 Tax=Trachydiscus minutus TaxID=1032745 RepID=A0A0D3M5M0_9STRA|nr:plastid-encoded DNA-directed RNA polymerase subunit beta' [Trachydiscus minutus]AIB04102.1 plastid-encoded DNA-directed RNA polymerase subunit beta' [Trachydiscus minutus]